MSITSSFTGKYNLIHFLARLHSGTSFRCSCWYQCWIQSLIVMLLCLFPNSSLCYSYFTHQTVSVIFLWFKIACVYNHDTIQVNNTVTYYGCLIGLKDGDPFRNINDLVYTLIFTFWVPVIVFLILYSCFWWKVFKFKNQENENQDNAGQEERDSSTKYKWHKIHSVFKFSFYIRVMIQILMTIVLISHPLCKYI